jgi:hypothetical protein
VGLPGKDQRKWEKVVRWVFLGRKARDSVFFGIPLECVYQVVLILQGRVW